MLDLAITRIELRDGQTLTLGAQRFSADNDSYYFHIQIARFPNGEPVTETMRFSKAAVVSIDAVCVQVDSKSMQRRIEACLTDEMREQALRDSTARMVEKHKSSLQRLQET